MTVRASDDRGGSDTVAVTIAVADSDEDEPPEAPDAPTVEADVELEYEPGRELDGAAEPRPTNHRLRLPVQGDVEFVLDGGR